MIGDKFKSVFGSAPENSLFTPGRVNLIGEHTDYNGGMVLPTALNLGPSIALSRRTDNQINIFSEKFEDIARRTLSYTAADHWSDYVTGAIVLANEVKILSGGADIAIETNLPFGAGLSSSAAVIVGGLKICRELSGRALSDTEIAVLARRVENEYIGMPCGIMDQMAVAIARPGKALALDTQTLDYSLVDLPKAYHMAVIHSGCFRKLSEGRYKIRKEECDLIKKYLEREDICRASMDDLSVLGDLPAQIFRRAKHCISEHQRTLGAIKALRNEDIQALGNAMTESHASMRDDFEISIPQIDDLVKDAVELGAIGARLTGGGFGGCIVACVEVGHLDNWKDALLRRHSNAFYVC